MRRIMLLGLLVGATLVVAGAAAGKAVHVKGIDISGSFPAPFLSEACGTPVVLTFTGTLNVTLVTDADGTVVREIDTQPGARLAFTATETGASFSFPNSAVGHFEYPEGTAIGAPALVSITGMLGHAPGIPADAGRQLWRAVVIDISPEGIPLVELTDLLEDRGNREEGVVEAICAALAAS